MLTRTPSIVAQVFLLLSVILIIAIAVIQINQQKILSPGLKYGIVLDAGSSRTTVYVYEWPAEKENDTGVVSQTFKCDVKGPGISSYEHNTGALAKPLDECLNKVKERIPVHLHKSTSIYLGATAGMRLLRLQNETAANEVLASVQNYFRAQPFRFRGAHIITGPEEGVYGWITANYLMGNFLERNLWRTWVHPYRKETMGALDLGGASTQISFIPEDSQENFNNTMQVKLYGYDYNVYTHSFQCYGREEAEKRLLALLLQAFSGFYYTINALNLSGHFSLADFNSSMWFFCSQSWAQLQFMLPKSEEIYTRSYCFSANFIYYLLVHGYNFDAGNWPQIHFQKEPQDCFLLQEVSLACIIASLKGWLFSSCIEVFKFKNSVLCLLSTGKAETTELQSAPLQLTASSQSAASSPCSVRGTKYCLDTGSLAVPGCRYFWGRGGAMEM
ncbi:ectonucleoside triphosphate diphosphohydrolase 3 isoform X3 [Centrocercus urophasianus]|uniref:ectonucleoside triphosphate diphosphohydrolase 3 isoform X3 n=1 Tax=Centrocercus urophasianus TaxID=9002 RepID=UPI001C64F094|nr:ectonucleoside triphosphate diphosphohydrolase 3 isoform X3 [Centrocercus urophasianus]